MTWLRFGYGYVLCLGIRYEITLVASGSGDRLAPDYVMLLYLESYLHLGSEPNLFLTTVTSQWPVAMMGRKYRMFGRQT